MALRPSLDFSALRGLARDLEGGLEELERDLKAAVARASGTAQRVASYGSPVFTGDLAGSWIARGVQVDRTGDAIRVHDRVTSQKGHALAVDQGREPDSTAPPLAPIYRWVELMVKRGRLDVSWVKTDDLDEAIQFAAEKIRWSIADQGIEAVGMVDVALDEAGKDLIDGLDRVAEKWTSRAGR